MPIISSGNAYLIAVHFCHTSHDELARTYIILATKLERARVPRRKKITFAVWVCREEDRRPTRRLGNHDRDIELRIVLVTGFFLSRFWL
jgi:hypothetical protein